MGTPHFAVPALEMLLERKYHVVAVVTATDKLGGRGGKQVLQSAVKQYAVSRGLKVLQPGNLKSPEFVAQLRELAADLQIVVAFRMLPRVVWEMPRLGTMNLHGSLLPKYRGAAPINWAIMRGEAETGVTSFLLKHEIDTGDMILQRRLPIGEHETAGHLHDRMMHLGAEVVLDSVRLIESERYHLIPQPTKGITKAPKLHTDTCEIDFAQPTATVYNFVRGLSPYPTAWTTLDNKKLKVYQARPVAESLPAGVPGSYRTDGRSYLQVATADGYLELQEIQLSGKRKMSVRDFLNGYEITTAMS